MSVIRDQAREELTRRSLLDGRWIQGRAALQRSVSGGMNLDISDRRPPLPTSVHCQSDAPFLFVLVILQPLVIAILLPEQRLIIRW